MNRKEYERGITEARKGIYKGKIGDAVMGALRALVAFNEPEPLPAARQLRANNSPRKIKRVEGKVVGRK